MSDPETPLPRRLLTDSGLEYSPITPDFSKVREDQFPRLDPSPTREDRQSSPNTRAYRRRTRRQFHDWLEQQERRERGSPRAGSPDYGPTESVIEETQLGDEPRLEDETFLNDEDDSSGDDMSTDIKFTGKGADLLPVITHCQVQFLAKPQKFSIDSTKSGYLAATFRGTALTWLTAQLQRDSDLLDDYPAFLKLVKASFLASPEVQRQTAEQQLRQLRQKGSAQNYTLQFEELMQILSYDEKARCAAYIVGLKPEVKKQLIGTEHESYRELRKNAIDYDESLFALRQPRGRKKGQGSSHPHQRPSKN